VTRIKFGIFSAQALSLKARSGHKEIYHKEEAIVDLQEYFHIHNL
jgi:hypothetical protein